MGDGGGEGEDEVQFLRTVRMVWVKEALWGFLADLVAFLRFVLLAGGL